MYLLAMHGELVEHFSPARDNYSTLVHGYRVNVLESLIQLSYQRSCFASVYQSKLQLCIKKH